MKFTRLRLSGFKSFVEPCDLQIEPGLTGVVGPNGCGKSNLLEALRWVMGESSYKSMRGSGMDDVIFSGTTQRPSRNMAEVLLTLTNEDRTAPARHNDSEVLEISRRIEREAGSAYRINGREARARDVQLLFADASTGARSPALVRQGQIGEIINAKPQSRRLILEEAAGITGLHTRRHEAELKLKAAEQNLTRLEDVTAQMETQLSSLKRQARQAVKYRQVSAEIRKLEAAGLYVAWKRAADAAESDRAALDAATRTLAEHTRLASEALRQRDELGERLPHLREQETIRAAVLQRISQERGGLDEEERRAEARKLELDGRIVQINADLAREHELLGDTARVRGALDSEDTVLKQAQETDGEARTAAAVALQAAALALAEAQEAADAANQRLSELSAERNAVQRVIAEQKSRIEKLRREEAETESRRAALLGRLGAAGDSETLSGAAEAAIAAVSASEVAAAEAEARVRGARQAEGEARQVHDDSRRRADRLGTEVRTLSNLLKPPAGSLWPPLIDQLKVSPGYEAALGAALGDDLDASADEGAPVHWRGLPPLDGAPPLPEGVAPLSDFVAAPPSLSRRLSHVGVVTALLGASLQSRLRPGQRLVSPKGDVWRWDGFTAAGDAPSAGAKRLAERNRLSGLETELAEAAAGADGARSRFEAARAAVEAAVKDERDRRDAHRAATAAADVSRRALATHERQQAEQSAQASALDEARRRIALSLAEAEAQRAEAETTALDLVPLDLLQSELGQLRAVVNGARASYAEQRSQHDGVEREARIRAERLRAIETERRQWQERLQRAEEQIAQLTRRADETRASLSDIARVPEQLAEKRRRLMNALGEAEAGRKEAADALALAENAVRAADQELRRVQELASGTREEHARLGARLEASKQRQEQCERRFADLLQSRPEEMVAEFDDAALPSEEAIEQRLVGLREDRERLGAVNLRAEEEAQEVARQLDSLIKERDDLVQAIQKLRGGISSLNREGRQRLLDAFGTVNTKFGELFTTLFGGGRAELQLVESDDPLEAGLEIVANPPGKKPTVLSLLSGGEQTLTALALIFAVFLTNPSPICVLDEVDAPLDDHNVERFCNLLDAMLERTDTRFLIITHHALTMARMHRLYGVTMMERGVSQLVSVDLQEAELMKEAS